VQLQAAGGDGNYTFSGSPLSGMTLTANGLLGGTIPAKCCAYASAPDIQTFDVRATDGAGHSGAQTITVKTSLRPTKDLTIRPTVINCATGITCQGFFSTPGSKSQADFKLVSGNPPVRITFLGEFGYAIIQVPSTFSFRLRAVDVAGNWAEDDITLNVIDPFLSPPTIPLWLNTYPPSAVVTHATSITCVVGQLCNWRYNWYPAQDLSRSLTIVSGSAPPGIDMVFPYSSATPQQAGSWTFRVRVVDDQTLAWGQQDFTIVVVPPPGP